MASWFDKYLLPGLVFQGVVIGGGYSTGRELVEFFLPHGPIGGLFSMLAAALVWSIVMAITFELCRMTRSYDYRSLFRTLLGRYWVAFEIVLLLLMFIILSVVGAAAGEVMSNLTGAPMLFGSLFLLAVVGGLIFHGNTVIERFMGAWSILLYLTYAGLVVWSLAAFGAEIGAAYETARSAAVEGGRWLFDGARYAGYNVALVATILFCLRHIETRKQALSAGILAGFMGMIPAVLFFVSMMAFYPEIGSQSVPSLYILGQLDALWFATLFQVVLLGTLIQTGVGLVHAINERIAATYADRGREMPSVLRAMTGVGLLSCATVLASSIGLVDLIAHGYGLLTYAVLAIFVIPVGTIGLMKVWRHGSAAEKQTS